MNSPTAPLKNMLAARAFRTGYGRLRFRLGFGFGFGDLVSSSVPYALTK
jgi:hypothetical protein